MKVLCLEEAPSSLKSVSETLAGRLGCEIFKASTVAEGLEISESEPELALAVCHITESNSELLEFVRKMKLEPEWKRLPLLVLTSKEQPAAVAALLALNVRYILDEASTHDCLMARLRAALNDTPGVVERRTKVLLALDMELAEYQQLQSSMRKLAVSFIKESFPELRLEQAEEKAQVLWPCIWDHDSNLSFADEDFFEAAEA